VTGYNNAMTTPDSTSPAIFADRSAALLISRQQLYPNRSSLWVRRVVEAIEWCAEKEITILTSAGMTTWELIAAAVRLRKAKQRLFIPASSPQEFERKCHEASIQFDLEKPCIEPLFFKARASRQEIARYRDECVIGSAEILLPICVRRKGSIEELLDRYGATASVVSRYQCPYGKRTPATRFELDVGNVPDELHQCTHLIHWTRTSNGAWPGERKIDYYRALLASDTYPRTAYHTLQNILATRTVRASSNHMPGKTSVVSFSACAPAQFIPLMKWRSRYRQMSFEPYGIGLEREWALSRGISPVRYLDAKSEGPKPDEPWLCQSAGVKGNWRPENEYRYRGDFDLNAVPREKMVAYCLYESEAQEIEKEMGICCRYFAERGRGEAADGHIAP
jgi:hypothetical protein